MRIDQLPVASSATNLNTIPLNIDGVTEQISVGNLSNAIRDDVYGAPLTASTSAGMTDQTKVYVYTGTTGGGFTNGHWYYYNGSAWTDGGAYNSSAVQTDTTLTLSGVPADAKSVGDFKTATDESFDSILSYGGIDLITLQKAYRSTTYNGITYTWDDDGTCTISGTASNNSFNKLCGDTDVLTKGFLPGNKYHVDFHGGNIPVRLYLYNPSSYYETHSESFDFTVPNNATGVFLRFQIATGTAITTPVTVKYTVTLANDNHGWLRAVDTESSEDSGKTDMKNEIMSKLTNYGYCHLGEGIFYVSGSIDMPEGSTLEGCGKKTTIRLLSSVGTGHVVQMQSYCTLQNVEISGAYSSSTPSTEGTRDGIWFMANYSDPNDVNEYTTNHCMISNVWINNFSGSGLYCHNTSINYAKGIFAQNAFISYCYKGINIDYYSEYNKFTNMCIAKCHIACVNNGGNNVFTACTFHATDTGFFIDGTQPNSAHGTLNGCTFCHIGSNTGKAVDISNATDGFVISACQFWYNSINVSGSDGIVFSGCEFGRGTTGNGMNINISGGNLALFTGCVFHNDVEKPPVFSITNNAKARFIGCYGGVSGNEIDPTA